MEVDETRPCELLVCTRDILTSHWRDGDVLQVFNAYDALRVHAETIANGRGVYKGDAVHALRTLYDRITDGRRRLPDRDDLLVWWQRAEALAGLSREDFARFPFTALERANHTMSAAARTLGTTRQTLRYRAQKYGLTDTKS